MSGITQEVNIFLRLTGEMTKPWALSPPSVFKQKCGDQYKVYEMQTK